MDSDVNDGFGVMVEGLWILMILGEESATFLGALLVLRRTHLILLGPGVPTPSWYQQKRIAAS